MHLGERTFYPVEFGPGKFSRARFFKFGVDVFRNAFLLWKKICFFFQ